MKKTKSSVESSTPLRTFVITLEAHREVIVVAQSKELAVDMASDHCTSPDWEIDEVTLDRELKTEQDHEQAKRFGAIPVDAW